MADAKTRALLVAVSLTWLAFAACSRQGQDEMSWARAALERNDRLEIIAADPKSRTFTVRNKGTGELTVLSLDQLIAGPAPAISGAASPATAAGQALTTPSTPAQSASEANPAAAKAGEAAEPAGNPPAAPAPPTEPVPFVSQAERTRQTHPMPGQVLSAGPGYTIEAGSPATGAPSGREPGVSNAPVEVRREPIVCQGARLLHIDNRNLQFVGDAVSAEDGCEIHITNSRIRATGVGVSARAANVHIDNSLIEGDAASIDASDGAQIYAASSRFRGLSRRLDTAAVHDLGGNVWN